MRNLVFRDKTFLVGSSLAGRGVGYTFTCSTCGEQWAKLDKTFPSSYYHSVIWPCENHGTKYQRGGSILKPFHWWEFPGELKKTLDQLSPELLLNELTMAIKQNDP